MRDRRERLGKAIAALLLFIVEFTVAPVFSQQPAGPQPQPGPQPAPAPAAAPANKDAANQMQEAQRRAALLGRLRMQIGAQVNAEEQPDGLTDVFIAPEREVLKPLFTARDAIAQQRYSDAVRSLGVVLELSEDYFFQPDPDTPIHRSLKSEAMRMIGEMPPAGLEAYELLYGARAQQQLSEAVAKGDAQAVSDISRRFFHTRGGREATYLLGMMQLDRGQPLAAALCLSRLADSPTAAQPFEPGLSIVLASCFSRAGMQEKSNEVLAALAKKSPAAHVAVAGRDSPLFNEGKPSQVLAAAMAGQRTYKAPGADQWAIFRGNVSRNASSVGSSPLLNARWRVPNSNDPVVERLVAQINDSFATRKHVALPAFHPLAVGDVVLMRTTTNLLAVDFKTGKRIWEIPVEDTLEQVLTLNAKYASSRGQAQISTGLEQRVWDDAIFGTLSSDGDRVFSVEDLDMGLDWTFSGINPRLVGRRVIMPNGRDRQPVSTSPNNRLAAHDIRTGKLQWELGGPRGEGELEQADTFFLGAPLPLVGRLYVLAESRGEIRLLVLEADTGALEWSQQLAVVDRGVAQDPDRRTAGATPSYADGVLVCPTSAGAIVAVDLTTRSLLWGYRYPRPVDRFRARQFGVFPGMGFGVAESGSEDKWVDTAITIAGGRVLVTPAESNEIFCLDLIDGSMLWSKPRASSLYVACVQDEKVLLVGRGEVRGLKLADGSPAWGSESAQLPTGSSPSGRGFFNNGQYYVPLSTAEVAAIDLNSGEVVARSKSRKGIVPGNLICYEGSVISQGATHLESFYQLADLERQVTKTLAERPNDPEALALRGEVLLHEGKLTESVDHLRRAYKIQPEPRTGQLLVDSLLDLLRSDYATHRADVSELEQLVDRPEQQAALWRIVASGEQKAGNRLQAFDAFLKLTSLPASGTELDRIDNAHSVRLDRWVQARLAELWEQSSPTEQQTMNAQVAARLAAAKQQPDALAANGSVRRFIQYFGEHSATTEAWDALSKASLAGQSPLETELALLGQTKSADPQKAGAAVARLAEILKSSGHPDSAAVLYRRLRDEFANQDCLDGKTGRQLVDELTVGSAVQKQLVANPREQWPTGLVEVEQIPGQFGANTPRSMMFDFSTARSPFFTSSQIETDTQTQSVIARDGLGRVQWRVPQGEVGEMRIFGIGANWNQARSAGHLVVLSTGAQLTAIDALASPAGGSAKVLWTQNLVEYIPGMRVQQMVNTTQTRRTDWGQQQIRGLDAGGQPIGTMAAVSATYVCFPKLRDLVAVDPLTGEELWRRHDLLLGSDLFGDEEFLFVAPPDGDQAIVLRAIDGEEVGRRAVPLRDNRMLMLGRRVLSWTTTAGQTQIKYTDLWSQEDLWTHDCAPASRAAFLGDEAVGVLELGTDQSKFTLRSLSDGRMLVEAEVTSTAGLTEIHLLRSADRYLLISNGRPSPGVQGVQAGGLQNYILLNGRIDAFDRENGKPVWSSAVESQALALEQPPDMPVLVLAAQRAQRSRNLIAPSRGNTLVCALQCIDKRNGRLLVDVPDLGGAIQMYEVAVDPAGRSVEVKTVRGAHRMTFTDQPIPAESAEQLDANPVTPTEENQGKSEGKAR